MPDNWVPGLPGVRSALTANHKIVFKQDGQAMLALGQKISGANSRDPTNTVDVTVLQPGLLMGKRTSGGFYAPSIIGVTTAAYTSGGTTLNVSAAAATEIVRRVGSSGTATLRAIGPPTAAGTVAVTSVTYSAVNTSTGDITVSSLGVDKIAGTFITAADGSQLPLTFIPDGYGICVVDLSGTSIDTEFPAFPISGVITSAQLVNWPSDTSLQSWIVSNLNGAAAGQFVFDHVY